MPALIDLLAAGGGDSGGIPLDTVIIGGISAALGILALINSSKAKQERAAVEGHAANIKAFDQAQRFYAETNDRLTSENERLARQNSRLSRQLDRFERLIHDLDVALPEGWHNNGDT